MVVAQFEVESAVEMSDRPGVVLVVARRLNDIEFEIGPTTKLDGRPVLHFDVPRALDAKGKQGLDVVGFFVEGCLGELAAGEVVKLTDG